MARRQRRLRGILPTRSKQQETKLLISDAVSKAEKIASAVGKNPLLAKNHPKAVQIAERFRVGTQLSHTITGEQARQLIFGTKKLMLAIRKAERGQN